MILMYRRKEPSPFLRAMRADRIARALPQAYLLGTGFASDVPGGIVAFLKSQLRGDAARPADPADRRLARRPSLISRRSSRRSPTCSPPASCCCIRRAAASSACNPADPAAHPAIMQNLLSTDARPAHAARGHRADARDRRAAVHGAASSPREFRARRRQGERRRDRRLHARHRRSPCITRSAPAAWASTSDDWRWSIPS